MARTKAIVRRLPVAVARSDFRRRTIRPFKIKEILPQQKSVNIRKDGQVIKIINLRRNQNIFQVEID